MGFFFLTYSMTFAIQVVKADYEGGTSIMNEENYGAITNMTTSAFQTINTTTYISLAWIILAFFVGLIMFLRDLAKNPSGHTFDNEGREGRKKWRWQ